MPAVDSELVIELTVLVFGPDVTVVPSGAISDAKVETVALGAELGIPVVEGLETAELAAVVVLGLCIVLTVTTANLGSKVLICTVGAPVGAPLVVSQPRSRQNAVDV